MADESELEELDLYGPSDAVKMAAVTVDQRLYPTPLTASDLPPRHTQTPKTIVLSSKLLWVILFLNLLVLLFAGGSFLVVVGLDDTIGNVIRQSLNQTKSCN